MGQNHLHSSPRGSGSFCAFPWHQMIHRQTGRQSTYTYRIKTKQNAKKPQPYIKNIKQINEPSSKLRWSQYSISSPLSVSHVWLYLLFLSTLLFCDPGWPTASRPPTSAFFSVGIASLCHEAGFFCLVSCVESSDDVRINITYPSTNQAQP